MPKIIIVSPFLWDDKMPSNSKEMALCLSEEHEVIYINFSLDLKTLIKRRKEKEVRLRKNHAGSFKTVNDNLKVYFPKNTLLSINWISNKFAYKTLNKLNNRRLSKDIKKASKEFSDNKYVLLIDNMIARCEHLPELLKPLETWYYSRDFLFTQAYFKKHQEQQEIALIKKADKVFSNSQVLQERARQWNSCSYYLPQAIRRKEALPNAPTNGLNNYAELKAFLKDKSRPKLCFYGIITSFRIDIAMLKQLVNNHPEYDFVLIGKDAEQVLSPIRHAANIFYIPWMQPSEINALVPEIDVLINPQLKNEYTNANSPRKILEYLSHGKPVVVTETDFIREQTPPVFMANTTEEFSNAIAQALMEKNNHEEVKKRIAYSQKYTWKEVLTLFDSFWPKP